MKFRSAPAEPALRSRPKRARRAAPLATPGTARGAGSTNAAGGRKPVWKQVEEDEQRRLRARIRESVGSARQPGQPRRYAVVYDLDGPRCTVGVVWFVVAMAALAIGTPALAVLYGGVAAAAGYQVATAWRTRTEEPAPWVAAVGAAVITLGVLAGVRVVGGAVLALVVAGAIAAYLTARSDTSLAAVAGTTVAAALFPALVGVGVVLSYHYEVGAAVTLVLFASAYECGDYLVGSGASNRVEGPAAGIVAIAVVALAEGVLRVPPFRGAAVVPFAVAAAIGCPLGQLFGSLLLPDAGVRARALRRLDSLLVLAPLWAWAIGLYIR